MARTSLGGRAQTRESPRIDNVVTESDFRQSLSQCTTATGIITQAALLNQWAAQQTLPVIAVGDYNFERDVDTGQHNQGYDLFTAQDRFEWVQPATLVTAQTAGWPCEFSSVLDFILPGGAVSVFFCEGKDFAMDLGTHSFLDALDLFLLDFEARRLTPASRQYYSVRPSLFIHIRWREAQGIGTLPGVSAHTSAAISCTSPAACSRPAYSAGTRQRRGGDSHPLHFGVTLPSFACFPAKGAP